VNGDYCAWPPEPAPDVEVVARPDEQGAAWVAGSAGVGRYLLLRDAEHRVIELIRERHHARRLCELYEERHGAHLPLDTLVAFLTTLDDTGVLAGDRRGAVAQFGSDLYHRWSLFNPDRLFERIVRRVPWIWTKGFFWLSLAAMLLAGLLAAADGAELVSHVGTAVREHALWIVLAGVFVGVTHEFAHGLTCKAFGGRATEIGGLLIYYCLPALYCNVSGLHLIPERGRRLWVIAAGLYWQLLVGAGALLLWLAIDPHTWLGVVLLIVFCGAVLDAGFNGNPLIKLDGYYFLSQWLRIPNLMDRSHEWWRSHLRRWLLGSNEPAAPATARERRWLATFGLLSALYGLALRILIVWYLSVYLSDRYFTEGLLLSAAFVIFFSRTALGRLAAAVRRRVTSMETPMATMSLRSSLQRVRVPGAFALAAVCALAAPWTRSVGSYGTLLAVPEREHIVRAPEAATLVELHVQPGSYVEAGSRLARLGSLDLDRQVVSAREALARACAEEAGLMGELRVENERLARSDLRLAERAAELRDITMEAQQIERARRTPRPVLVPDDHPAYPPAFAVLRARAERQRAEVTEAEARMTRTQKLFNEGLVSRQEVEAAVVRVSTARSELLAAGETFEAASVDHARRHRAVEAEWATTLSERDGFRLSGHRLTSELQASRRLIETLENHLDLLLQAQARLALMTTVRGTVFGEDVRQRVGHAFAKGDEVLRVADTSELLVRIQVPEREIGSLRLGQPVRLKARAFPGQIFRGQVRRIGGSAEADASGQPTYRIELTIENPDGQLMPGMTAFARIDVARWSVGRVLMYTVGSLLRPELWML
jgi:multidrug efflux pump subunit AcrA (membrane-fusion protein)